MTGFRPSDWSDDTPLTIKLERPLSFDFKDLLKREHLNEFSGVILISTAERHLLAVLAGFVFEYTFVGKIRRLGRPDADAMVEYGVSRFKKEGAGPVALTDEPIAILAFVTFIAREGLELEKYLTSGLNSSNAAYRGIIFEPFVAYLLARAFSSPKRLSEVFNFPDGSRLNAMLEDEVAELVTLTKGDNGFTMTPFQIHENLRSSHILGHSPSTNAGTLEWLQNPEGSVFCYPANTVGPDLIFILRLKSDDTVLRVCVQCEHVKDLTNAVLEKAVRTTNPAHFLSQEKKDGDSPVCSNQSMRGEMEEAFKNLGKGSKKAGKYGLLRVIASYPSIPDSHTLEDMAGKAHPLAMFAVNLQQPSDTPLGQAILSLANQALLRPDHKRKFSDEAEGARPKRQRT